MDKTDIKVKAPKEHIITRLGFGIIGFMNNFSYIVGISAAIDIVETAFPKSIVLLCDIGPGFLISFIYPFIHQYVQLKMIAPFIAAIGVLGFILAGLSSKYGTGIGLTGVICFSMQIGMEGPTLSHSGKFHQDCTNAFSVGMGVAGLVGSGAYALLTTALHIQYEIILYSFSPLPLLILLGTWFTYMKPSQKLLMREQEANNAEQQVDIDDTVSVSASMDLSTATDMNENAEKPVKEQTEDYTSMKEKMKTLKHNLLSIMSLWLVYVFQYTTTTGINPTMIFGGQTKAYYKYAAFAIRIGNLAGRCSVLLFKVPYWSLPCFTGLCFVMFVLFILQSIYRYVDSIWVMLAMGVPIGISSGVIYSDTMAYVQVRNQHDNQKSYALGVAGMSTNLGVVFSTFCGSLLEVQLKKYHPEDWTK